MAVAAAARGLRTGAEAHTDPGADEGRLRGQEQRRARAPLARAAARHGAVAARRVLGDRARPLPRGASLQACQRCRAVCWACVPQPAAQGHCRPFRAGLEGLPVRSADADRQRHRPHDRPSALPPGDARGLPAHVVTGRAGARADALARAGLALRLLFWPRLLAHLVRRRDAGRAVPGRVRRRLVAAAHRRRGRAALLAAGAIVPCHGGMPRAHDPGQRHARAVVQSAAQVGAGVHGRAHKA
mmetsp:Transcript_33885/g.100880  ORF Transcript_33885/g.100880 Transcript_33885/m.100880 type:complete len:242 (-) Transcript_33885:367-1092(-)